MPAKLNETITGPLGQWARLRLDPQGGYIPGHGPQGVYYVEHHAPWFPDAEPATMASYRDKGRAVRALNRWVSMTEEPPPVN